MQQDWPQAFDANAYYAYMAFMAQQNLCLAINPSMDHQNGQGMYHGYFDLQQNLTSSNEGQDGQAGTKKKPTLRVTPTSEPFYWDGNGTNGERQEQKHGHHSGTRRNFGKEANRRKDGDSNHRYQSERREKSKRHDKPKKATNINPDDFPSLVDQRVIDRVKAESKRVDEETQKRNQELQKVLKEQKKKEQQSQKKPQKAKSQYTIPRLQLLLIDIVKRVNSETKHAAVDSNAGQSLNSGNKVSKVKRAKMQYGNHSSEEKEKDVEMEEKQIMEEVREAEEDLEEEENHSEMAKEGDDSSADEDKAQEIKSLPAKPKQCQAVITYTEKDMERREKLNKPEFRANYDSNIIIRE